MKKTICGILAVLFLILPLSGCGSWEDKVKVSDLSASISNETITGTIENITNNTLSNITVYIEFKGYLDDTWVNSAKISGTTSPGQKRHFSVPIKPQDGSVHAYETYKIKKITF